MLKYVAYRTYKQLNCSTCNAQIILQIKPEFALGGINFLNSVITTEQKQTDLATGKTFWYYEFSYDDALQLIPEHPTLIQSDIIAVGCKSILTEYFDFLTAQATESVDRKYFPSQRVGPDEEVGVLTGLVIPNIPTDVKQVGSSFTNTDNKPVWVTVQVETPLLALTLANGNGYSFSYHLVITNNGTEVLNEVNIPIGGFRNSGPDFSYDSIPNGLTGVGGAFKVQPGQILAVVITLNINGGPGNAGNEILVNGPWINMLINPADIT